MFVALNSRETHDESCMNIWAHVRAPSYITRFFAVAQGIPGPSWTNARLIYSSRGTPDSRNKNFLMVLFLFGCLNILCTSLRWCNIWNRLEYDIPVISCRLTKGYRCFDIGSYFIIPRVFCGPRKQGRKRERQTRWSWKTLSNIVEGMYRRRQR